MKYLKTKRGYFYKIKNGKKKRISRKKFSEKNKTRKIKKMIGGAGEPIEQSDIMYEDDLVCILKPEVKKGIIIWTHFTQPAGTDSLCNLGLKAGNQLQIEGIDFGRSKIHPYIFFRAPFYSRDIDYTSVETEIRSSYGEGQIGTEPRIFIRVDPDRTFVFSSEIRAKIPAVYFHTSDGHLITKTELSSTHSKFFMPLTDERYSELYNKYYNDEINKSKKTLSEYLVIIKENELRPGLRTYDLHTSRKVLIDSSEYPYNQYPIERSSEILVSKPHLTPDYFVLCTPSHPSHARNGKNWGIHKVKRPTRIPEKSYK